MSTQAPWSIRRSCGLCDDKARKVTVRLRLKSGGNARFAAKIGQVPTLPHWLDAKYTVIGVINKGVARIDAGLECPLVEHNVRGKHAGNQQRQADGRILKNLG